MHFKDQQELIRFLRSKPVEPKRYEDPEGYVREPEQEDREAQHGEVLQAD